jgi:hypothetical protein
VLDELMIAVLISEKVNKKVPKKTNTTQRISINENDL